MASTWVSNWDDWLQKWQSSGQPPVLADRMPSTSTSGPHQARRTSWASAASDGTALSGSAARAAELVERQLFAAVEQRVTGFGDQRTGVGGEHASQGRRRPFAAREIGASLRHTGRLTPPSHGELGRLTPP